MSTKFSLSVVSDNYDGLFRLPEGLPPSFIGKPTIKQNAKIATIQIDILADPSPSLHWSKDGKELLNAEKFLSRLERKGGNKYTIYLDIKVIHPFSMHSSAKTSLLRVEYIGDRYSSL